LAKRVPFRQTALQPWLSVTGTGRCATFDHIKCEAICEELMIRHTVVFKLKHPAGSQPELEFLRSAQKLLEIPTVKNFECLRQISEKNGYDFGLSMEFDSSADYENYNSHPHHVDFVQTHWIPEVTDFMEIDYKPYDDG
jgi:hypothetical protein